MAPGMVERKGVKCSQESRKVDSEPFYGTHDRVEWNVPQECRQKRLFVPRDIPR